MKIPLALAASLLIHAQIQPPTAPPHPSFAFHSDCATIDNKTGKCRPSPDAPHIIVLITCRVDDHTGEAGRHDPALAAHDWRDLEPHVVNGELQCKRQAIPIEDKAVDDGAAPLHPDFGESTQWLRAGLIYLSSINLPAGWATLAIGGPVPETDQRGAIIAWGLPSCPNRIGGLEGVTCKFDESSI